MDYKPGDWISQINKAYETGDIETVKTLLPQLIKFVEYALESLSADKRMSANGGVRALRMVNGNAQLGTIGSLDHECFIEAAKFLSIVVLLPDIKETNPQAVKDAGLWDYCE